jgi:cell division protease FtsH
VVVDRPDLRGREAILRVHAKGVALDPNVDLRTLAARTPGFTGADLANVVNEGALLAARREKNSVGMEELEEAIDRVVAGLERKSRVMSERDKIRVAVHEMGHALVALRSDHIDPVHRVTIVPRGVAALGITMVRPLEDRYLMTEPELRDRLVFAMGGRAAEQLTFGEISTGAQNDLQQATEIARAMVVEYGMSTKVGPLSFGSDGFRSAGGRPLFPGERPEFSDETARVIDEEVARLLREAQDKATEILDNDKENLRRLSDVLIEREVIEGSELRQYLDGEKPIPTKEALQEETRQKRADEKKAEEDKVPAGPEIILTPSEGAATPTQEIPVRPDA